jgi:hypothetical protein
MNVDEVIPVLDVHPPHEPIHGWRDFFLHLATITIGLLIALGLEGCVEWMHHRHLVHEAQAALRNEISNNESNLSGVLASAQKQETTLKQDIVVLDGRIEHPKENNHETMSIEFRLVGFADVSWKTAQSTGALTYMPYARVEEYAEIYGLQQELYEAQKQGVRDAVMSIGLFANKDATDPAARVAEDQLRKQRIEVVQGQLFFVESLITGLDDSYKKFLAAHPE